ncbi:MAG: DUF1599 domain-containing protein [Cyclobacteriaceae bacterium]
MKQDTAAQYQEVISECKDLFGKKTRDYGTAWRILRVPSITDQIFIKAQRIRSIQEKGTQKIADNIRDEFIGIINYCLIAMMQLDLPADEELEIHWDVLEPKYDGVVKETFDLQQDKNHDYGEAWRDMRIPSITDIILMKLYRVKQIEDNEGETIVSEGIRANYQDMINYAVFCMIKMNETAQQKLK